MTTTSSSTPPPPATPPRPRLPRRINFREIPRVYVLAVALVVLVPAACVYVYAFYFQTYHFAEVDKGKLYRTGFRTFREYETTLSSFLPTKPTVVSLVDATENHTEPFQSERGVLIKSKYRYRSLAVPLGGWPTTEQVRGFLRLTTDEGAWPILVHCAQGVRRTGMFVAAYQLSVLHWDKQKTKDAILTFGHSDRSINDIKHFIDIYDPATQTVTESPARTNNK